MGEIISKRNYNNSTYYRFIPKGIYLCFVTKQKLQSDITKQVIFKEKKVINRKFRMDNKIEFILPQKFISW